MSFSMEICHKARKNSDYIEDSQALSQAGQIWVEPWKKLTHLQGGHTQLHSNQTQGDRPQGHTAKKKAEMCRVTNERATHII